VSQLGLFQDEARVADAERWLDERFDRRIRARAEDAAEALVREPLHCHEHDVGSDVCGCDVVAKLLNTAPAGELAAAAK
jgi:hypothetical protein